MKKEMWVKAIVVIAGVVLLAAGCSRVELRREVPSSPRESYEALPK